MITIQQRIPLDIQASVQHEVQDLKEDFLSLIYDINKNEKPVWTMLKELKDIIPSFIDTYILKVLAQKYDLNRIKELKRKMPKKSLMNCRQILNSLITSMEQENLVPEYLKMLVMIINNTNSSGQELTYQRFSKNWRTATKMKLLALMLLVYQYSLEKQKNIFNIIDLWYKIYPETPVWQLKDERFSQNQQKQDQDENIMTEKQHEVQQNQRKDHSTKGQKISIKKNVNKDDLLSYELDLLEQEFNKNLRISDNTKEDIDKNSSSKKGKKIENVYQKNGGQNSQQNNIVDQIYEDEQSTTQEEQEYEYEQEEDDDNQYSKSSSSQNQYLNNVQQSSAKNSHHHNKRNQPHFVKQTRFKKQGETFSPKEQISALELQFEKIHIETEQIPDLNQNSISQSFQLQQNSQQQYQSQLQQYQQQQKGENNLHKNQYLHHHHHSFTMEENHQKNRIQIPHASSSILIPLNDTTYQHTIKNNLNSVNLNNTNNNNSNSPSAYAQFNNNNSFQHSNNQLSQPNFNLQQNENNPVYFNEITQSQQQQSQQVDQNNIKNQQSQSQQQLSFYPQTQAIPILRNPCHQIFDVPLKDSTNNFNYFIQSQ